MINCLIVEDEPLAAEILQDYMKQVPFLLLKETCTDAMYALEVLQRAKIDLIFLDVHLPGLKGLDFLKTLKDPPAIIITTAYHEYAIQGYELNVVDYLLKPIEFQRFVSAVNKVHDATVLSPRLKETLTIQAEKKRIVILLNDVLYIESQKEYIMIHTIHTSHKTKLALSKIEELLDAERFLRVHRSFIVALHHIEAFDANNIELPKKNIPIGGNYKEVVSQRLSRFL